MTAKVFTILKPVCKKMPKGNIAFDQLEELVNEHSRDGWQLIRGIAVSLVLGLKAAGSIEDNWYLRTRTL